MALKRRNSSGQSVVINADGYSIGGGTTTERKISITGGDVDMVGGGAATITMPAYTDTLVGRIEMMRIKTILNNA
jgi:hypothetical protein